MYKLSSPRCGYRHACMKIPLGLRIPPTDKRIRRACLIGAAGDGPGIGVSAQVPCMDAPSLRGIQQKGAPLRDFEHCALARGRLAHACSAHARCSTEVFMACFAVSCRRCCTHILLSKVMPANHMASIYTFHPAKELGMLDDFAADGRAEGAPMMPV
jgi:hypothetical protein